MQAKKINVPSEESCIRIMADMGMLENIIAHSLKVCGVALFLTDRLGLPGLNRELIRAAALLHDITKTRSFRTVEDHAETGARLLMDLGYPEVAGIVGQHVRLNRYVLSTSVPTDAEIVNYSDKRVLHDRIVPLSTRMGYILEKYGSGPERKRNILLLWEKTEKLEKRLFAGLPFSPGDISGLLSAESSPRVCRGLPHIV
ncbi:MAG: HDIG family protein [uncultured bacterium]|nr:MAG: HDIG family protein [uncultured bacterium]